MKKSVITTGLLVGCLSLGQLAMAVAAPFPDVDGQSEHAGAIGFLKNEGIVSGYNDGDFRPDNTINRAEALKLVFLARKNLGLPEAATQKSVTFPDVKSSDWYHSYVKDAFSLGIVQGYNDGYFRPANEITRAESLKIIYSGLVPDLSLPAVTSPPFVGINIAEWYAPYLQYGLSKHFIEADSVGSYLPDAKMTRAEFSEAIYRVLFAEKNSLEVFPLNTDWRYCNATSLGYKIKRPYSWETFNAGEQLIFWNRDQTNGQVSFARLFPNSAVVIVAVDDNENRLPLANYLDQIEYGTDAKKQLLTLNGLPYASIILENSGLQDSYFELPDGKILAVYAQTGDGALGTQLKEQIRYMVASVRASTSAGADDDNCFDLGLNSTTSTPGDSSAPAAFSATETMRAQLLAKVLVAGQASASLEQVGDSLLFETDSIGIGTGPVDYFHSQTLDLSIKVERGTDTILATKSGKTSSF